MKIWDKVYYMVSAFILLFAPLYFVYEYGIFAGILLQCVIVISVALTTFYVGSE